MTAGPSRRQQLRVTLGGISRVGIRSVAGLAAAHASHSCSRKARSAPSPRAGEVPTIEVLVSGDSDDWRLATLAITNVYVSIDGVAAVVPSLVAARAPGNGVYR